MKGFGVFHREKKNFLNNAITKNKKSSKLKKVKKVHFFCVFTPFLSLFTSDSLTTI